MQHYLGVAKDEGISEQEIGAAQAVVMAVAAGKVSAQWLDATTPPKVPPENSEP